MKTRNPTLRLDTGDAYRKLRKSTTHRNVGDCHVIARVRSKEQCPSTVLSTGYRRLPGRRRPTDPHSHDCGPAPSPNRGARESGVREKSWEKSEPCTPYGYKFRKETAVGPQVSPPCKVLQSPPLCSGFLTKLFSSSKERVEEISSVNLSNRIYLLSI